MKIGGTEEAIEGHRGKCKVMKGRKTLFLPSHVILVNQETWRLK